MHKSLSLKRTLFVLLLSATTSGMTMGAPIELGHYAQLERSIVPEINTPAISANKLYSAASAQRSIVTQQYPVITKTLSASGRHSTVYRAHAGTGNVFLIGADFYSTSWLRKNHEQLKKLGAQGIVVNVRDAHSFSQLKNLAKGLPLIAASFDDLAILLNLKHYPVLITESVR